MRIVRVKLGRRDSFNNIPGFVYCGRSFGGFDHSPLHNPFKVGADGSLTAVLAKFHTHLRAALQIDRDIRTALVNLTADSVLGCWCVNKANAGQEPWRCHCDAIAHVWVNLHEQYGLTNEENRS